MGIAIGVTSIVARFLGAKEISLAQKFSSYGIFIGFFISIFLSLTFSIFSEEILTLFKANKNIIPQSKIYMKICSVAVFFNTFSTTISEQILLIANNTNILITAIFKSCNKTVLI